MTKMDAEISKLENSREQVIEKQLETLRTSLTSRPAIKKDKPNDKPQEKRPVSASGKAAE